MGGLLLAGTGAMANLVPAFAVQGNSHGVTARGAIGQARYNAMIQCAWQVSAGAAARFSGAGASWHVHVTGICGSASGNQPGLAW